MELYEEYIMFGVAIGFAISMILIWYIIFILLPKELLK